MDEPRGRYTRGYLPHIEAGRQPQFVTWRLKDSLAPVLLGKWRKELEHLPERERNRELHSRIEGHLDAGSGCQILKNPIAAQIVQDALIFGHPDRYHLCSWVVMSTHVHALLSPTAPWTLSTIMQSMKGFTSREIGKALEMPGQLWQEEPFDVLIRDEEHFYRTWKYIEWNPVKAGKCSDPKDWPYSSANPVAFERLTRRNSAGG